MDLSSDPLNCGTCGLQCVGGDCKAGVCQPASGIEPSSESVWRLAADEQNVFLAQTVVTGDAVSAALWRTTKQGGAYVKLAELQRSVTGIELTSDDVILTLAPGADNAPKSSAVIGIPKSGGPSTALATEVFWAWSPIVNAGELFWIEMSIEDFGNSSSALRRLPLSGNGQVMSVVEAFPSQIRHIAVDDERVYFSAWMEDYLGKGVDLTNLFRVAKTGGEEPKMITGTENAQMIGPKLFESKFFFFTGPWHDTSPMHWYLQREGISPDGYAKESAHLAEFDPTKSPWDFVVDPSNVYWTRGSEGSPESELMRTAAAAAWEKDPQPILTGLGMTNLAQDDESLYFVNKANALVRLAK